jgi:PEP-CTERM motif
MCMAVAVLALGGAAVAEPFDGAADNQLDSHGYYYAITGGLDPGETYTDPTTGLSYSIGSGSSDINGNNGSGGTFRYITDDPAWGYPLNTWNRDDWFPTNMSLALTLGNAGSTVYDNNGILAGIYGDFYDGAGAQTTADIAGLYRGFAMSNNFDFIYSGMFILGETTTFDSISGFFDANAGLDPDDPGLSYHMNIWSAVHVTGTTFDPVNTGGFTGDVWSSDSADGSMSWSDTGVDRVYYGLPAATDPLWTDDIWELNYALDDAITLGPGVYFFSHDATINPVPEPASMALLGMGIVGVVATRVRRKRNS